MYFVNVIFLVFACTYALSAQTEHRSVQTSETKDNYTFRVRQNEDDSRALVRCMNRVTTDSSDGRQRIKDLVAHIEQCLAVSKDRIE